MLITEALLAECRSENGGWNRAQFGILEVKWPPKPGWKRGVIGKAIADTDAERLLQLRKKDSGRPPTIERGELEDMHAEAKAYLKSDIAGAASLLASVGACLGNWPRVKARKVEELRERVKAFREQYENLPDVMAERHLDSIANAVE